MIQFFVDEFSQIVLQTTNDFMFAEINLRFNLVFLGIILLQNGHGFFIMSTFVMFAHAFKVFKNPPYGLTLPLLLLILPIDAG